jgi:hypothetical protein
MEFFMENSGPGGHPLDVTWADSSAFPGRVQVGNFSLIDDGDGLKTAVRVFTDPALLSGWRELGRTGVIEQEKRAELPPMAGVRKH